MNRKSILGIALAFLCCAGSLLADENYVHSFTGFTFPPSVMAFSRIRVTPFNEAKSDIEVDYDNKPFTVHLSAYVYPAKDPLQKHYEQIKAEVVQVYPGAKLLEEKPVAVNKSGVDYHGFTALYDVRSKIFGKADADTLSKVIVFRRDDYYVLYRISYSPADKADAESKISDFLDQFAWPTGGKDVSAEPAPAAK